MKGAKGPRLTIAGGAGSPAAEAVVAAWPGRSRPGVERLALSELTGRPGGAQVKGPLLIVLGGDEPLSRILEVVDRLQELLLPAVVMHGPEQSGAAQLQTGGVIFEPLDAAPCRVAAELYALGERQGTVDALRRELRIASSLRGGVRGQLDRMHEEMNLAAVVQQEALPEELPSVEGVSFGVLFRPAAYVSGDIYDVARIDGDRVCLFIADAVGHGVPAALLTMIISRALRSARSGERPLEPAEAVGRLNEELIRAQHGRARFATAVYAVLDLSTRRITLTCAGHPAPLLARGGRVEPVEVEGPLLGVFEGERFEQRTLQLERGDTLLMYSDGFETAFPDQGADGDSMRRGTRNYIRHLASLPWPGAGDERGLELAMARLGRLLDGQAGSLHQVDDVTAIAVSMVGEAGVAGSLAGTASARAA